MTAFTVEARPTAGARNGDRPPPVTVGVLALQGDFKEHCALIEALGTRAREVRTAAQLEGIDALIIPGGESTTIARLIAANELRDPLRAFCASGKPVWGTCAGAILLASTVDELDRPGIETMDISVARNAFGRQVDSFEEDLLIEEVDGPPFHAVFIRAPSIVSVGPRAKVLARLRDGTIVAARERNLLATVFHPELTSDTRLHSYFLGLRNGASGGE